MHPHIKERLRTFPFEIPVSVSTVSSAVNQTRQQIFSRRLQPFLPFLPQSCHLVADISRFVHALPSALMVLASGAPHGATRPPVPLRGPGAPHGTIGPLCLRPRVPMREGGTPSLAGGEHLLSWAPCSPRGRKEGRREEGGGLLAPGGGAERSPGTLNPGAFFLGLATRSGGPLTRGSFVRPVEEADS